MALRDRLEHAWNAFRSKETEEETYYRPWSPELGMSYASRPDRTRISMTNERSIITSLYVRLAVDTSSAEIRHVRLDENERYQETVDSGLNNCLTVEANIDQAATAFRQDMAMTLFERGVIAIVPVDTSLSPLDTGGFDIKTLRVGEIIAWYPRHVKISLYNDIKGRKEEITMPKASVAIVENPLYSVMNEPNSTLQRLIRKLNILDSVDEAAGSGKLDLIIQLPYVIKSETRRQQADQRRKDIENQLKGSKYGIAYTDGTEKITQLNRPAENNMLAQIKYLMEVLYGQLGLTEDVFNGTADEKTMLNYYTRTIDPILTALTEGIKRAFLTKTARSQGQSVEYFRDPFKLVPVSNMADIGDKFTRNEILSPNEIRGIIGFKPSEDPKANQLMNRNMPSPETPTTEQPITEPVAERTPLSEIPVSSLA